ncbi:hypothetical protein JQK87_22580 [Streptomyces sp. G44]|uniref:hypothetical protein n=1 Tax=Streptomyces sp. G44 TaxID=2807632 RepID=UPI00195F3C59|nr:hypothetical protein [Streptomyces sp. G44]MBM7171135.1 hypothetical protein [Streptomyces sp. G44]
MPDDTRSDRLLGQGALTDDVRHDEGGRPAPAACLTVDLLLVFAPGADWAHAISGGLRDRSVVLAVAGPMAGHAAYPLMAVAGLAALVATSPSVFTTLTAPVLRKGAGTSGRDLKAAGRSPRGPGCSAPCT